MLSKQSKNTKFMKEGSYGCVYKPGLKCDGTSYGPNSKIISKIIKKQPRSEKEPEIGQLLKTRLPYYDRYFSPAVDSCKIELSKIKKTERQKCKLFHQPNQPPHNSEPPEYISMKMTYVGKNTFGEILDIHYEKSPQSFWAYIQDTYEYLLCALEELETLKLVHYDIKENNILYSDSKKVPILIDFGSSFQISELYSESNLRTIFPVIPHNSLKSYRPLNTFQNIYWPRCLDVYCITTIIHGSPDLNWEKKRVNIERLQEQVNFFFDNHPMVQMTFQMISPTPKRNVSRYKQKWLRYVDSWKGKSGKTVVNELLNRWNTWDLYSVNIMYLGFMYKYRLYKNPYHMSFLVNLVDQLFGEPRFP